MKRRYLFLISIIMLTGKVFAGDLTINPAQPTPGSTVAITYIPDIAVKTGNNLKAIIYTFFEDRTMPVAYEGNLVFESGKKYSVRFLIPDSAVFGLIKVGDGVSFDNRNGEFWDFLVRGADGKTLKGSNFRAGTSYLGNYPSNFNRKVNFERAFQYLENEVELYPGDIVTEMGLISLRFDLRQIKRDEFEEKIRTMLNKPYDLDDENTVVAVTRALRVINEEGKSNTIEDEFAQDHPKSKFSEDKAYAQLAQATSMAQFNKEAVQFLERFPNSQNKDKVFLGLLDAFIQVNDYNGLKNLLDSMKNVPSTAYSNLALNVVHKKELMPNAEKNFRDNEAIRLMDKALDIEQTSGKSKPTYIAPSEWERIHEKSIAGAYEVYGNILLVAEKYSEALDKFQKSMQLYSNDAPNSVYEKITESYVLMKNDSTAYSFAHDAIINSKSTIYVDSVYKRLYMTTAGTGEGDYLNHIGVINRTAKTHRLEGLNNNLLNQTVNLASISTIDGIKIDFNALKGKVVMINFWSTWCSPCLETLIAIDSVSDIYKDNNNVVIISVNVWENSSSRKKDIKKVISENEIDVPVYIDKGDKLPESLGITGLPTTVFIDKQGEVQFKETGYNGPGKFIQSCSDKLDFLLSN